MEKKLTIAVIAGTTRPKRRSIHAAHLVAHIGEEFTELKIVFVDPVNFSFPYDGDGDTEKDPEYSKIIESADGFFIVTPEYNHSFPGSLKRMLDTEFDNYKRKPVAFAGVSSGQWGGVRAIEALTIAVRPLSLVTISQDVHFPMVKELFDEEGKLLDDSYRERVRRSWRELIWMAKVLKSGRDEMDT